MIISSWNVRGMNDPQKVVEIKKFLHHHSVSVGGLLETRVNPQNFKKFSKNLEIIGIGSTTTLVQAGVEFGLVSNLILWM